MLAITTLRALEKAISEREYNDELIHHSDRSLQYFSSIYPQGLSNN